MAITWVETVPSPTSDASTGDDELRAFMASVSSGLSPSFIWPGSGVGSIASAGLSQLGNARLAVAGNSAVTGGYQDGFLLLNRNHESLHHIGSTWTAMLGHASMIDHTSGLGFTQASQVSNRWLTQAGTFSTSSANSFGTSTVTFTTPYNRAPFVHVTPTFDSTFASGFVNTVIVQLVSVTSVGFISVWSATSLKVVVPVTWESDGTVPV